MKIFKIFILHFQLNQLKTEHKYFFQEINDTALNNVL